MHAFCMSISVHVEDHIIHISHHAYPAILDSRGTKVVHDFRMSWIITYCTHAHITGATIRTVSYKAAS